MPTETELRNRLLRIVEATLNYHEFVWGTPKMNPYTPVQFPDLKGNFVWLWDGAGGEEGRKNLGFYSLSEYKDSIINHFNERLKGTHWKTKAVKGKEYEIKVEIGSPKDLAQFLDEYKDLVRLAIKCGIDKNCARRGTVGESFRERRTWDDREITSILSKENASSSGPPKYWAGGITFGEESQLDRFLKESIWQHDFPKDTKKKSGQKTWRNFGKIKVGDYFALKGIGGQHDLVIHLVGKVIRIEENSATLKLEKQNIELFKGKGPKESKAGNWHDTIVPVTRPDVIKMIFGELSECSVREVLDKEEADKAISPSLNTILYGPPGTGKTYNTINHAVAICDSKTFEQVAKEDEDKPEAVRMRYRELVKAERIAFTTFHQSMSYEDFVEGIKPDLRDGVDDLRYVKKDGLFKAFAKVAGDNWRDSRKTADELSELQRFEVALQHFIEEKLDEESQFPLTKNCYLYAPTEHSFRYNGKNWTTYKTGLLMKFSDLREFYRNGVQSRQDVKKLQTVSGLARDDASYYFKAYTAILEFLPEKHAISKVEEQDYVLIIDEINRGNVSAILGELITLIEPDKRLGQMNELVVPLPYTKEVFGVPPNLHIIGTMNTADRSVEALDTALRRRFEFIEMTPDVRFIPEEPVEGIELQRLFITMNSRIEALLDKDHCIGHSYLMHCDSLEKIQHTFKNKIIPLLEEYFYGDPAKIGAVLGSAFVIVKGEVNSDLFAKGEWGIEEYERKLYEIVDVITLKADAFKGIYASPK